MLSDRNFLISSLFQLSLVILALFPLKRDRDGSFFMTRDYTAVLKALCCLSVILAHTGAGEKYCILGFVHWIAVSLFFLFSGYGISYGAAHKPDYLQSFHKRILKVAIPLLLAIALKEAFSCDLWSGGMGYMLVAILFYAVFFLVRQAIDGQYTFWGLDMADRVLIVLTILYSLSVQFFHDSRMADGRKLTTLAAFLSLFGWGCQSLGFAYGVILARKLAGFKAFLARRRNSAILLACCLLPLPFLALAYLRTRDLFFVSWTEYALRAVMVLLALLIIAIISRGLRFGNRAGIFLGSISGEMFLLHGFVIEMLNRHTDLCQSQPGIFVVLVYLLTFAAAVVLHLLLRALYRLLRI